MRKIGGWDPYNVTEDADLGVRLKARGYRTAMLDEETAEEATSRYLPWHRQRTRWQKGWLQTWLVYMRSPLGLYRSMGPRAFAGFQLYIGGLVFAPFAHLFMLASLAAGAAGWGADIVSQSFLSWQFAALVTGYAASYAIACKAVWRRDRRLLPSLVWLPLYWLLISFAAIHSVWQLCREPFYWSKTPHGFKLKRSM